MMNIYNTTDIALYLCSIELSGYWILSRLSQRVWPLKTGRFTSHYFANAIHYFHLFSLAESRRIDLKK